MIVAGRNNDAAALAQLTTYASTIALNSWSRASKTSSSSSTLGEIASITAKPSRARIPSE